MLLPNQLDLHHLCEVGPLLQARQPFHFTTEFQFQKGFDFAVLGK